jgi:hypothetical protein
MIQNCLSDAQLIQSDEYLLKAIQLYEVTGLCNLSALLIPHILLCISFRYLT